jgi:hypothetical protein
MHDFHLQTKFVSLSSSITAPYRGRVNSTFADGLLRIWIDRVAAVEVGPGCRRRDLPGPGGMRVWVVDIAPGSQWPEVDTHGGGGEAFLVVSGEVIEGEQRFGAGSYVAFAPHSRHRPRSETGVRLFGFNPAAPEGA